MGKVAVDFGTSNTVIARLNEATEKVETVEIPEISRRWEYQLNPKGPKHRVSVTPSLIHYGENEKTLIGDQVVRAGLESHPWTFRGMKLSVAGRNNQGRQTPDGFKTYREAAHDFLVRLLQYASNMVDLENDEFTFSAPIVAFEDYQNWLWDIVRAARVRFLRMVDEPTGCIFGYDGRARGDSRFIIYDFGGGTLDISVVRLDMDAEMDNKAVQLSKEGEYLGGMSIDHWIAEDFCLRHRLGETERRELEGIILYEAEQTKIALSQDEDADMTISNTLADVAKVYYTTYRRECDACKTGGTKPWPDPDESCLGCLLNTNRFMEMFVQTEERALFAAARTGGIGDRNDITQALAVGGTTLLPQVRRYLETRYNGRLAQDRNEESDEVDGTDNLETRFNGRLAQEHVFDCVARGACKGGVLQRLQHDYAIEFYNPKTDAIEFAPLYETGVEYPTDPDKPRRFSINGVLDGSTRLELKIYEVAKIPRRVVNQSIWDKSNPEYDATKVVTDRDYIFLNKKNPTCIVANPPVNLTRDKNCERGYRFLCLFSIDENRRLLVTVLDRLHGNNIMENYPVVRL